MRYQVLAPFKVKTSQGEIEIQLGQIVTRPHEKALKLLNEGKIKPFCYWLKSVVDDCLMPCFEIDAKIVNHECPHFKTFWAERLKKIERKCNVNR